MRKCEDESAGAFGGRQGGSAARLQEGAKKLPAKQTGAPELGEAFRTFIVHFMGDVQYSFYNAEHDKQQEEEKMSSDLVAASPSSALMLKEDEQIDTAARSHDGASQDNANFAKRLEKQACDL